jgi:hypothetical protein
MAILGMQLLKIFVPVFFIVMASCAILIVVSFMEDMKKLLEAED